MTGLAEIVAPGTALALEAAPFALPRPQHPQVGEPEPACRFAGEPLHWVRIPPADVHALARSTRRVYQKLQPGLPGDPTATGVLLEVSPLPGFVAGLLHHLAAGLPVQYVLLDPADAAHVPQPDQETCVATGERLLTSTRRAWFGLCFQDRICRDPRSWVTALDAAAVAGAVDRSPQWAAFVAALRATGPDRIRVLDHVGRPRADGSFEVTTAAGSTSTVTLSAASPGDTGLDVAGAGAALARPGTLDAILALADRSAGAVGTPLALTAVDRHVLTTDVPTWLAPRSPGVTGLTRYTRGNTVEPIVDGNPYFARLVEDLRRAKGGGAAQLAGWAFVKESLQDQTKPWSLIPGDDTTQLVPLVDELISGGADVRLLVNQFLQISDADLATLHVTAAVVLMAVLVLLGITQAATWITTDRWGWVALMVPYTILPALPDATLRSLLQGIVEPSKSTVADINGAHAGTAVWTPYPAALADNPLAQDPVTIEHIPLPFVHHFGVYHQKIAMSRAPGAAPVAYVGGIDINSDRVDDPLHRAIAPFHDVQVRLTGPAVDDVARVFTERAQYHGTTAPIVPAPAGDASPATGDHITQIGRTLFAPGAGSASAPLPSAPQGEHTTHETLLQAIAAARDFIYIEDQYFTPDTAYVDALVAAADPARGVRALVVTVPDHTDQVFGPVRRGAIISRLAAAWQDRFRIGSPVRRPLDPGAGNVVELGRMVLRTDAKPTDAELVLGPAAHVPKPPFWAFVEGELVLVDQVVAGGAGTGPVGPQDPANPDPPGQTWQRVNAQRGSLGGSPRWGAKPGKHDKGSAVLAVQIPGIYVHAKLMIVDDVFLSVGSSNLNRRGLEHDGEINSLTIPASLKRDPANPALRLRCRLWAEHLGLPPELGLSLLADPLAALPYFDRSWYRGNRWQPLTFGAAGSLPVLAVDLGPSVLAGLRATVELAVADEKSTIWATLVDPTTRNDPHVDPGHDRGPEL